MKKLDGTFGATGNNHGNHEIFAGGKAVPLNSRDHSLVLRQEIVTTEVQHDLDKLGIAKTAREEKILPTTPAERPVEEREEMTSFGD